MNFINAKKMLKLTKSQDDLKKEVTRKHVTFLLDRCKEFADSGHRVYSSPGILLDEYEDIIKKLENLGYKVSFSYSESRKFVFLKIEW